MTIVKPVPKTKRSAFVGDSYSLHGGNVLEVYEEWPTPDLIVSDGAYGVRGFHGDTTDTDGLVDWYSPHVQA